MMANKDKRFKNAIYEQLARIGKAISSPKRLELLDLLAQGERTVEVLAREANLTVANTSRHLQILRKSRFVDAEKEGLFVTYRLANASVSDFLHSIRSLAENRLAELEWIMKRFLEGKEGLEPVDREELFTRVKKGAVTVLDVRPVEEYCAGHISTAVSIPLKDLEHRLSEIPKEKEIVAYCRGPYCVLAIQAVEILRAKGYHARRFEESIQDWRAHGLPVEVGGQG